MKLHDLNIGTTKLNEAVTIFNIGRKIDALFGIAPGHPMASDTEKKFNLLKASINKAFSDLKVSIGLDPTKTQEKIKKLKAEIEQVNKEEFDMHTGRYLADLRSALDELEGTSHFSKN